MYNIIHLQSHTLRRWRQDNQEFRTSVCLLHSEFKTSSGHIRPELNLFNKKIKTANKSINFIGCVSGVSWDDHKEFVHLFTCFRFWCWAQTPGLMHGERMLCHCSASHTGSHSVVLWSISLAIYLASFANVKCIPSSWNTPLTARVPHPFSKWAGFCV